MTKTGSKEPRAGTKRYIEIVNWRKAQPRMAEGQNFWCKLYTDLLDNDAYHDMDNASRVLVTSIWMYAARTGKHVFPADPKWLHKRIPMLHEEPNFEPLLNARNIYGEPTPFLRFCDAPAARDGQDGEFEREGKAGGGRGKRPAGRKSGAQKAHPEGPSKEKPPRKKAKTDDTTEEKRRREEEKKREETPKPFVLTDSGFGLNQKEKEILADFSRERRDPETLRTDSGFGVSEKKKEKEILADFSRERRGSQEQIATRAQQSSLKPEKPVNPKESEAGEAQGRIMPMPPLSARGLGQRRVEQIIVEHVPAHWLDEDAEDFGWQIVKALGLGTDRGSRDARSDWGAFASWWCKVKAGAPPMVLAELRVIAISKAAYLFRKGRSARKKQAVWFSIMQAEMLHHGIRLPPARASPLRHTGA